MVAYQITIVGHVDRKTAPSDWPDELHQVYEGEFDDQKHLVETVTAITSNIALMQGMLVRDNPYELPDPTKLSTDRRFVMLRMFTHLTTRIKRITGEIPQIGPDGKPFLRSGKDLTVN